MGSGPGPMALWAGRTFVDNLPELSERFALKPSGYFGSKTPRNGRVRIIESVDPAKDAYDFQSPAGNNPSVFKVIDGGKEHVMRMRDGTIITYRRYSNSDGTPVVELSLVDAPGVRNQKIHFVKKGQI